MTSLIVRSDTHSPLPQSLAALITVLNQFPDSCSSQHTNSGGKIIYKRLEFLFEDISLVTNFSVQRKCALISNILNKTLKAVCGIYLMICEGRFVKIFCSQENLRYFIALFWCSWCRDCIHYTIVNVKDKLWLSRCWDVIRSCLSHRYCEVNTNGREYKRGEEVGETFI